MAIDDLMPAHKLSARPANEAELRLWRKAQRFRLLQAREALPPQVHAQKSRDAIERLVSEFSHLSQGATAFYWPIHSEIDLSPFIEVLLDAGGTAALPVVVAKGEPLQFRLWKPGDAMASGVYGIQYPAQEQSIEPDALLVPLVGFDPACFRLGYGGGYYDCTLLSMPRRPLTVGVGFAAARLATIYPQAYDVPLDWIVTEAEIIERSD